MGFISDLAGSSKKEFPGQDRGRSLWREIFGSTTKEDKHKFPPVVPGGSWGRSSISTDASQKRLLQAMRSMAPGGWSDNRYEETRHLEGIQFVCIKRTCELLSQAEFQVFIKDPFSPEGRRPVTPDDLPQGDRIAKPYDLVTLLEKPNNDDSFGNLMESWNQQLDLTGMALTWMVPNQLGTPYELYPMPTAIAVPQPAINPDFPDGYYRIQPIYPYGPFSTYPTPASAVGAPIPAQWVIRIKYPHPLLRYDGYSPLTAMRLHIDEIESMDRSRFYSMKRTINPSAVLNFDGLDNNMEPLPEPEINRIKAEFEDAFMGPENAGQLFVGSPGSKLEPWGARPIDMDYQAGWSQLVSFVMSGFGITKPAAGMVEDTSYSTLFATLKQFHLLTLDPKCNRIANKLTRHLAPFFGDNLIVEVRCKRIDDHDIRNAELNLLMGGFAMTKNELRQSLGKAPTTELWGADIAGTPPIEPPIAAGVAPGLQEGASPMAPPPMQDVSIEENLPVEMDLSSDATTSGKVPGLTASVTENTREEPSPVMRNRSQPDKLGRGALGPRKSLSRLGGLNKVLDKKLKIETKSFYDIVREVCSNGH